MSVRDPNLSPREVRLRDLRPTEEPILILGRVVALQRREITRRSDGGRRPILSGLLSDGTATVRFTWWDPPAEGIEQGMVLRAANVQIREYQGRPELSFGFRTRVEPASEVELPKLTKNEFPLRSVATLGPAEEGFSLEVRVVRVAPKNVTVGQEQRVVYEGLVADRGGTVAFTSWSDFQFRVGEAIRITGGYLRNFRGQVQVVLDGRTAVERIDGLELPAPDQVFATPRRSIAHVEAQGGGALVRVEGVVVGVVPPSGLVYRCPSCRRSVSEGTCRVHGRVEGVADLRCRLAVDDGTGCVVVNASRSETERLCGVTLAECLARVHETRDPASLEVELSNVVLGRRLAVLGRATKDDFGVMIHPESIEEVTSDIVRTAEELRARLSKGGKP
jgi:replication factor A1